MNRTYYTLEDLITQEYVVVRRGAFGWQTNSLSELLDLGTNSYPNDRIRIPSSDPIYSNNYVETLFKKHVWPKYYNSVVLYLDNEIGFNSEEANTVKNEFAGTLYSWLMTTSERYGILISNLEDAKNQLLKSIRTVSRFNDTPQNDGEYEDLDHNTTVTVTEADGNTPMARLKEIEDDLTELYRQWSLEFGQVFVIWSA